MNQTPGIAARKRFLRDSLESQMLDVFQSMIRGVHKESLSALFDAQGQLDEMIQDMKELKE